MTYLCNKACIRKIIYRDNVLMYGSSAFCVTDPGIICYFSVMRRILFYLLTTILLLPATSFSQGMKPGIRWTFVTEKLSNGDIDLVFTAELEEGWVLYARENTLFPLEFSYADTYDLAGDMRTPPITRKYDDILEAEVVYYSGNVVVFRQKIRKPAVAGTPVKGTIMGQVCRKDEICVPMYEDFVFTP